MLKRLQPPNLLHTLEHASKAMNKETHNPQAYLPLSAVEFHILAALADMDRHGYAILKDIEERTDDSMKLGFATLYRTIRRMADDGLLIEVSQPEQASQDDDSRRKYYHLTNIGVQVLHADALRQFRAIGDVVRRGVVHPAELLLQDGEQRSNDD
jgi:DNA-binding PadR family transcriptional regulator